MSHQDSVRSLLNDVEARKLGRRDFMQRAIALGMTPKAMAMVLGAAGVAVPGSIAAAAQSQGGSMAFAVTTDPETLDPHMTSSTAASSIFERIYSSLIYRDIDLTYKGLLAESWEVNDDSTEITFKLREGVTFHDGTDFNAESVKYTIDRLTEIGSVSPIHETAAAITPEVVDDYTVKLIFDAPNAAFFNAFERGYGGMLSESAVEAAGEDYGRQPVGTNAYQLSDWQTGSSVSLSAFENFTTPEEYFENDGAPYIEEIVYRVIAEPFAQVASLETGEVDAVDLTAADLPRFENDERFEIFEARNSRLGYLGLTRTRPMMEDPRVRKAIAHATNREEIVNTVFEGGLAEPVSTPLPPSVPGYNEELEALSPEFDLDAARALLDEAGWIEGDDGIREKDGMKLAPELYTTTSAVSGQLATLLQGQYRLVGIDVNINAIELATLLQFTPEGEHDMLYLDWNWSDPDVLYLFLSTDRMGSSNRVHYSNPDFDALLVEGQQTLDHDARMEVYYRAQEILLEDLPWIPLYMPITKTAVNTRLQGVQVFPTGGLLLNDASVVDE